MPMGELPTINIHFKHPSTCPNDCSNLCMLTQQYYANGYTYYHLFTPAEDSNTNICNRLYRNTFYSFEFLLVYIIIASHIAFYASYFITLF